MNIKQIMTTIILLALLVGVVGWKMYQNKKVIPQSTTVSTNKDQEVIDNLIKYGSDPEKEHLIEFAFYADWSRLNKLKDYLLSQGYEQIINQTDQMLVVGKYHKLHLDEIEGETKRMEELAKEYDVEFDGWSTNIVR